MPGPAGLHLSKLLLLRCSDKRSHLCSRPVRGHAARRVRGCYASLELRVDETKTAVARVWGRKFLGYCFCSEIAADLRGYVPGWQACFRLAQTPKVMRKLDEWLRHRLRAVQLKQWRRATMMLRAAQSGRHRGLGGPHCRQCKTLVAQQPHGPEPRAAHRLLRPPGSSEILLTSTSRTARCGPACRVVWEGSGQQ
jgi:hypothetical protein